MRAWEEVMNNCDVWGKEAVQEGNPGCLCEQRNWNKSQESWEKLVSGAAGGKRKILGILQKGDSTRDGMQEAKTTCT